MIFQGVAPAGRIIAPVLVIYSFSRRVRFCFLETQLILSHENLLINVSPRESRPRRPRFCSAPTDESSQNAHFDPFSETQIEETVLG